VPRVGKADEPEMLHRASGYRRLLD
jgi:hypothetical protein